MRYDEAALLERLRVAFPQPPSPAGIGDDAAILQRQEPLVLTTDMLVEDVDFTRATPIEFVAEKSLAVNLSDLAAMGATPLAFLLAIGLTRADVETFDRFVDALARAARPHALALIGGDLSAAAKLTVSITAVGYVAAGSRALLRSGARPGDRIYVSRPLGGAAAGLQLLAGGWSIQKSGVAQPPDGHAFGYAERELAGSALMRQVSPEPEVELGKRLAASEAVTACIDLSDGLSTDLRRLCEASACAASIDWDRIPLFPDLAAHARAFAIGVEACVLHGGEDYALLFTSPLREAEMSARAGRPVFAIGRIGKGSEVVLERNGREEPLSPGGFDHFAR